MPDFPAVPLQAVYTKHGSLSTADITTSKLAWHQLIGNALWTSSTAWGTANLALYYPVYLDQAATVYRMGVTNGATVAGNFDLGIYNFAGTLLVSTGSTAQSGVSAHQDVDVTDTVLSPGMYYLAMSTNSTTATYTCAAVTLIRAEACGVQQQTSAFALPSPATLGTKSTQTFAPIICAYYASVDL